MSICQSFEIAICQSFEIAICQSFETSICQSFEIVICQSFEIAICQSFEIAICQSFKIAICQSFETSICQSFEIAKNMPWILSVSHGLSLLYSDEGQASRPAPLAIVPNYISTPVFPYGNDDPVRAQGIERANLQNYSISSQNGISSNEGWCPQQACGRSTGGLLEPPSLLPDFKYPMKMK